MAATRLISMHVNKGKTVAQCLKARTDYSMNEAKTNAGEFVSSYECDPKTVDEEFLLAKRQYQHITGRTQKDDVIAYQIRQAFKPGEVTPEEANEIGYELAMRFTKGRHAFIVATHVDRAHIHNHIIYNSTSLDHTRKFRDFRRSGLAVQRVSDSICLEHGLSVIKPLPFGERRKRAVYPEEESFRDKIRATIEQCMQQKTKSVEELLHMLEEAGYEVKRGKNPALRGKGQKRFIRFRSLGEEYLLSELERRMQDGTEKKRGRVGEKRPFDLLINIQEKLRQGKSGGYERWAKVFNLKQMAQSMNYLQEQGYCILERNWTNKGRKEIDIIAIKDDVVVFVEVKTRKVGSASTPISAVNERKQRRIILAADSFVKACRIDYCCRFDVVGIIYDDDSSRIEHFVDAFRPRPKYY